MKKGFLLFTLLGTSVAAFSQIPNPSFENWANSNPVGWEASNQAPTVITVSQSNDAHEASSSANLTVSSFQGLALGGALTATDFPIDIEPLAFSFWYKTSFDQGDMLTIAAEVDNEFGAVRAGTATITENTDVWTQFILNMDELNTEVPTLGNLTIFTQGPDGGIFSVHPNTSIFIDDLSYLYIVGVEENQSKLAIQSVYPNPSNGFAYVQYAVPTPSKVKVEIFDLSGKLIATPFNAQQGSGNYRVELPTAELAAGVYTCRVSSETATSTSTFVVE